MPNSRWSDIELELFKRHFTGAEGDALLKVIRKVFYPQFDLSQPLGQFIDLWQSVGTNFEQMSPYDRELAILARVKLVQHVEGCLLSLQSMAGLEPSMTADQVAAKTKKDSTQ